MTNNRPSLANPNSLNYLREDSHDEEASNTVLSMSKALLEVFLEVGFGATGGGEGLFPFIFISSPLVLLLMLSLDCLDTEPSLLISPLAIEFFFSVDWDKLFDCEVFLTALSWVDVDETLFLFGSTIPLAEGFFLTEFDLLTMGKLGSFSVFLFALPGSEMKKGSWNDWILWDYICPPCQWLIRHMVSPMNSALRLIRELH